MVVAGYEKGLQDTIYWHQHAFQCGKILSPQPADRAIDAGGSDAASLTEALAEKHDKKIRDLMLRKCFENGCRVIRFFVFISGIAA